MNILAEEGHVVNQARSRRVVHAPNQALNVEIRPARPHVILIGGYAGSGKTELGRILTRETGWSILDKDTLTRPVVELALEALGEAASDRESDTYQQLVRPREYEALIDGAVENVECGRSVIVSAPYLREFANKAWIDHVRTRFSTLGATVTLIWIYCDAESMYTYLRRRGAARDARKLDDWSRYLSEIDLEFRPMDTHLVVDNSLSSDPLAAQAKDLLNIILTNDPDRES